MELKIQMVKSNYEMKHKKKEDLKSFAMPLGTTIDS